MTETTLRATPEKRQSDALSVTNPARTADEVRESLRVVLAQQTPLGTTISDQERLPQSVLDSLAITEVLAFVEDRIGRRLEAVEENESTIESIDAIVDFIQRHSAI